MTITVRPKDFARAVAPIISLTGGSTIPALANFRIRHEAGTLSITATNLEITATIKIPAQGDDIDIMVEAKIFTKLMGSIPDDTVSITIGNGNNGITVKHGAGKASIPIWPGSDFPSPQETGNGIAFDMPADAVGRMVARCAHSIGGDTLRPVMMGYNLLSGDGHLRCLTTDATMGTIYETAVPYAGTDINVTVPAPAMAMAGTLFTLGCQCFIDDTSITFLAEHAEVVCRLIDHPFPSLDKVVPRNGTNVLTVDRDVLMVALRRVGITEQKDTHRVIFHLSGSDHVALSSENLDMAMEGQEDVLCTYEGEPMDIAFSSQLMASVVKTMPKSIRMVMSTPKRGVVITGIDDTEDVTALLMPIMIL